MDQLIGRIPAQDGTFAAEDTASDANSLTPRSALLSARSTSTIMSASTQLSDTDSEAMQKAVALSAQKQRRKKIKRRWVSVLALLGWSNSPIFSFSICSDGPVRERENTRTEPKHFVAHGVHSARMSSRAGD